MKALIVLLFLLSSVNAVADNAYFVYLVRHAEKDLSDQETKDPNLTPCGEERANRLANLLQSVNLEAVYSTDFKRTQSTATPTASSQDIVVESYDPFVLNDVLARLTSKKQNALVVGHSNTTNVLAGMLAGVDLEAIDEDEYDRLYQVVVTEAAVELQLLHQAFHCINSR